MIGQLKMKTRSGAHWGDEKTSPMRELILENIVTKHMFPCKNESFRFNIGCIILSLLLPDLHEDGAFYDDLDFWYKFNLIRESPTSTVFIPGSDHTALYWMWFHINDKHVKLILNTFQLSHRLFLHGAVFLYDLCEPKALMYAPQTISDINSIADNTDMLYAFFYQLVQSSISEEDATNCVFRYLEHVLNVLLPSSRRSGIMCQSITYAIVDSAVDNKKKGCIESIIDRVHGWTAHMIIRKRNGRRSSIFECAMKDTLQMFKNHCKQACAFHEITLQLYELVV